MDLLCGAWTRRTPWPAPASTAGIVCAVTDWSTRSVETPAGAGPVASDLGVVGHTGSMGHPDDLEALRAGHASIDAALAELEATRDELGVVRTRLEAELAVWQTTELVALSDVAPGPLVSVVMATRNRADVLPRAIESVRAQTYDGWELLVVDETSTDATPEILRRYSDIDDRISTIRLEHGGADAARDVAIARASGDHVTYLDDDNVMHPGWIRAIVWAFADRPDVDVLQGACLVDDATDLPRVVAAAPGGDHPDSGDVNGLAHRSGRSTTAADRLALPVVAYITSTREPGGSRDGDGDPDPDQR